MPSRASEIEERVLDRHIARLEGLGIDLSDPIRRLRAEAAIRSTLGFQWECLGEAFADFGRELKAAVLATFGR